MSKSNLLFIISYFPKDTLQDRQVAAEASRLQLIAHQDLLKMTEELIGMIAGVVAIGLIALYVNLSSRKLVKK